MDSNATDLIFGQRDGLASAKLLAVFALHAASLSLLFVLAHGQPSSTLGRFAIIAGREPSASDIGGPTPEPRSCSHC